MEEKSLKETLNLPSTTLAMRANATVRELEIQKFWESINIYDKILEKTPNKIEVLDREIVPAQNYFEEEEFIKLMKEFRMALE